MSVKRRLFISNMLMIILPPLLIVIVGAVIMFATANILGIHDSRGFRAYNDFSSAALQAQQLEPRAESMIAFCDSYSQSGITVIIFQNGDVLSSTGDVSDGRLLEVLLAKPGTQNVFMIDSTMHKIEVGEFIVLLEGPGVNAPFDGRRGATPQGVLVLGIVCFTAVFMIILLTNQVLTQMVYKSISAPLDTLVDGVHQLRDGNLEHRIKYMGKDEFAGACSAFNDMAGRLGDMVNARQKDDENRRELIAGISHDLRTPLTSIISYVEGLEKGIASTPEKQQKYLNTIKNKAKDLEHIVSQLFLFSKLDVGEFPLRLEKLDIGTEISGFVAGVADEYSDKGLQIKTEPITKGIMINADVVQLRSAITNILDNSLKYGRQENGEINIACGSDGGNAVIILTDNGPGVPADALENLFSAFYRSDKARGNPGQGSGLGLAITAKILERLGGSIAAENAPESGLRITMKLPTATEGQP